VALVVVAVADRSLLARGDISPAQARFGRFDLRPLGRGRWHSRPSRMFPQHLLSAPAVASLFCLVGQFPAGLVFGCALLVLCVIAALAAPLDANIMSHANSAMFFMRIVLCC
jgi:hypothetical protein